MRPPAHPLDFLDADGDGRAVPQLEADVAEAYRRQWKEINAADLPEVAPRRHHELERSDRITAPTTPSAMQYMAIACDADMPTE